MSIADKQKLKFLGHLRMTSGFFFSIFGSNFSVCVVVRVCGFGGGVFVFWVFGLFGLGFVCLRTVCVCVCSD